METEADFAAVLGEFHFSGPWMVNLVEVAGGAEEFNFLFFFLLPKTCLKSHQI